jgi:diadenosine tetraphosphate (Ap4A) HIT family hydrolase
MPETPEESYRRAEAAAGDDGRLAMPPVSEWDTFPFEGDIRVRRLLPPVPAESPRAGEDSSECFRCRRGDEDALWGDERWILAPTGRPSGLPVVVILFSRLHCDLDDLPDELAAELGPMIIHVERAVRAVGNVGRVHVGRWGDGSAHLHLWFMARPARLSQLRGSFAAIWDDILPPLPEDLWRQNLEIVATAMGAGPIKS